MSYTNADGLYVLTFGGQGETINNGSTAVGVRKALVVEFPDLTALADSSWTPTANDAFIPAGAIILKSTLVVDTTATSGGAAVLDVGLYEADGSVIDDDGLDAALTVASLTGDTVIDNDGADVGTKVGSANAYVGATYDTAAFTAGAVTVVVEYIEV